MDFEQAFDKLISYEGGYVFDPHDPGGETRYGISKRAYPSEDIAGLTLERAKVIYLRDYWGPAGCDAAPNEVKLALFDLAVHSGVVTAIKMLQGAVGEVEDGILGPLTLQAAQSMPPLRLAARLSGLRLLLLVDLTNFKHFGRGWVRRVAKNLIEI